MRSSPVSASRARRRRNRRSRSSTKRNASRRSSRRRSRTPHPRTSRGPTSAKNSTSSFPMPIWESSFPSPPSVTPSYGYQEIRPPRPPATTAQRPPAEEVAVLPARSEVHRLQGLPDDEAAHRLLRQHPRPLLHRHLPQASEDAAQRYRARTVLGNARI